MSRIITSINFDLKFNVIDTPPAIAVGFTEVAAGGQETHGNTTILGARAQAVWDGIAKGVPMLAAVNAALDEIAADVAEPGGIAARITAAGEAEKRARDATAAREAAEAGAKVAVEASAKAEADRATAAQMAADLDVQIIAKRAELAAMSAPAPVVVVEEVAPADAKPVSVEEATP